jgi:hypothetical protein
VQRGGSIVGFTEPMIDDSGFLRRIIVWILMLNVITSPRLWSLT